MADRRMFTRKVTDDDHFSSLSSSAQALYLHLSMSADDDGFNNQVSTAMFKAHASVGDLEALLTNRYIYQFENGVIVIKHWRMANALRKDRYTPTAFKEELSKLTLDENNAYTMSKNDMVAVWLPDGCQMVAERLPQDRLDKVRLDKNREGEDVDELNNITENQSNNITYYGTYSNIPLTDEELKELKSKCPHWEYYINRISEVSKKNGKKYPPLATILKWYEEDKAAGKWSKAAPLSAPPSYDLSGYTQKSLMHRPVYKKKGE